MAKYKSLIVTTLLSVAALTGAVTTGVVRNRSMASSFEGDGYIVNVAETEEGLTAEPVYFSAGTKYKKTYPDEAVFKDIRGTKYTVDQDSFVHYQDGSMSAMTSGVVLNLDDVNGGLVNTYSFDAGTVLASNGTGYTAENNGASIPFDNFVWKLSDDRYYVYSDNLQIETVNGTMEDMSGGVQVDYLEDGIIRLSSENTAWQGIAAGAKAVTGDGATLSFDNKVITDAQGNDRMTLGEILMDADDNIKVQSAQDWVPPEFEFTAIDGENGQIGADGVAGQAGTNGDNGAAGENGEAGENGIDGEEGEAGDDGDDGSDGSSGKNGSAGSNGKLGGDGANGSIPQNQATEQATISLSEFEVNTSTVSGTISVIDEDGVLEADTGAIKIIDLTSGDAKYAEVDGMPADKMTFSADTSYKFTFDELNADRKYRLVVSSEYSLSENSGTTSGGSKDFINRTFYTDSTGITINLDSASTTGFAFTIDKKEGYSENIRTVHLTIKDSKNGAEMFTQDYQINPGENSFKINLRENGYEEKDTANTTYTVVMGLTGSGVDKEVTQEWKTLKRKPVLDTPVVNINSQGYFEISQPIEKDLDHALTSYRYEIYNSEGIKVKEVTSTSPERTPVYQETGKIVRGENYTLKAFATYYDNEKSIEIASPTLQKSFRLDSQGNPVVYFVHRDEADNRGYLNGALIKKDETYIHQSTIWGDVMIEKKDLPDLVIDQDHLLTVTLQSSGNYHQTFTFDNDKKTTYDAFTQDVIAIPIQANGLMADTNYRISVTGFVKNTANGELNQSTRMDFGSTLVSTTAYEASIKLGLTRVVDPNASFSVQVTLESEDGYDASAVEAKVLDQMKFTLYEGTNNQGEWRGDFTLSDNNRLHNQSEISDNYLNQTDETKLLTITNQSFGISNNALTGNDYYLEFEGAYDYTASFYDANGNGTNGSKNESGFKNRLPIEKQGTTIQMSNALPSLPKPDDQAVTVTEIRASELKNSAYPEIIQQVQNLDDDTVVGYRLQALLKSNDYAETIRYFGFRTAVLNEFNSVKDQVSNAVDWTDKDTGKTKYDFAYPVKVEKKSNMPPLQVLFLNAPTGASAGPADVTTDDSKYIKGVQTSGSDPLETNVNGCKTVFTGSVEGGLSRGHHYTFGFKVRMKVDTADILYPDQYKLGTVSNPSGLLCSPSVGAPRQSTEVAMYLKRTENGASANTYNTIWNLKVLNDVDHTWDTSYTGTDSEFTNRTYTNGMLVLGVDNTLERTPEVQTITAQQEYKISVPLGGSDTIYRLKMYQAYYDEEDKDLESVSNGQILAMQDYTAPTTITLQNSNTGSNAGGITVTGDFPESSNEVTFTLTGQESLLNRLITVKIAMFDDNGKKRKEWKQVQLSAPNGGNSRTATIDLTTADSNGGNLSGKYHFTIQAEYADAYYGMPDSWNGKTYVAKIMDSDTYMNSYYSDSASMGAYYANKSMDRTYLYRGGYKVTVGTDEAGETDKADKVLRLMCQYDGYSSVNNLDYEMKLYYGKGGAEWRSEDSANVYNMTFCEIKSTKSTDNPDGATNVENLGDHGTITVGALQPSISWLTPTPGITSAVFNFYTGSYNLIEAPAKDTDLGENNDGASVKATGTDKYIMMKLYELHENEDITADVSGRPVVWQGAVKLSPNQTTYTVNEANMSDIYIKDNVLSRNTYYKLVCSTWVKENGKLVEKTMLGQEPKTKLAYYRFKTISTINITDGSAENIIYESYTDKSTSIHYKLDRVNGYELKYELLKYNLGEGTFAGAGGKDPIRRFEHKDVMEKLFGYSWDGEYWKKGNATWRLGPNMTETLNLAPGGIMEPGYDYVLAVKAVDGNGELVSTEVCYIQIPWAELSSPIGNISFRITNAQKLVADVSLLDRNRVVISGKDQKAKYLIARRETGTTGKWECKGSAPVNNSTSTDIALSKEELKKNWDVGIFAALDLKNQGNLEPLTQEKFETLSASEQEQYLVASETKEGIDQTWGGSLGKENISIDENGNVVLTLGTSYGLEKIERVEYSALCLTDAGESQLSGKVEKNGKQTMFETEGTGAAQTDTLTILTGISREATKKTWSLTLELYADGNKFVKRLSTVVRY